MRKISNNTLSIPNRVDKRINWALYFIMGIVVIIFGIIVEKNISLPQTIIRPIGVTALVIIFFSAFFKPEIPFLMLVAYLPFCRVLVGDFGTEATALNLTNILMFIAIIGWIVKAVTRKERIFEKSSLNLLIFAFICWGILSLLKSSFSYGSIYFDNYIILLKRWLTPIILYFIVFNTIKDKALLKKTLIIMMFVIFIIGLMAVKDYIDVGSGGSLDDSRIGGVFEQSNTLGGFFVYNMFLFAGFLLVYFPTFKYLLMIVPLLVCFRGIQVTFSRGAYLGCFFGGLATTFFKNKILFAIAVFLLVFAILNPVLLPAGIRKRMSSTFYGDKVLSTDIEEIKDNSAQTRITIWKGAIAMIRDYPIFGVGYGLFPQIIPFYVSIGKMDAHNTYLILAAEMGIPALIIFLLILFMMIKNAHWLYRKSKDKFMRAFALGMLGCLFGLLMVNMFGSRLNSEEVSSYFWIYSGMIMAAVRMKKGKKII